MLTLFGVEWRAETMEVPARRLPIRVRQSSQLVSGIPLRSAI